MAKIEIISPLPGIFYRSPSPESDAFVQEGDQVNSQTVVGLIEVMKQFSELTADHQGTLIEFCVSDSSAVEPGQVIALVETEE
ncbi:acetyl-CoA carboxylase [Neptunomonas phycophila]|uniref:acetyl-CoA carboxylase n=1 Tax=Neptunomonas phycophila TaxID=1572645 RepID=UPI000948D4C4|nr:acetyl-CoA carboxylase [Neptunomonas phycophila]MBT3147092.1 biotin carboxyl carrier domain-containing protein [Neptunomonas phycophila]QLE98517.1 biotin carboxyl carrier domain-containing protein [Neptunomonas phycophila]